MVARTDTAGAWVWNGSLWVQALTVVSFPDYYHETQFANFYGTCRDQGGAEQHQSSLFYFTLGSGNETAGFIYTSTNKGVTWTRAAGFSSIPCDAAASPTPNNTVQNLVSIPTTMR